ncbi:MAG: sensor histidine kinase [Pseudomonadota bacterium]
MKTIKDSNINLISEDKRKRDLEERVKELHCLHELLDLFYTNKNRDDILSKAVYIIKKSWQYPECTEVRLNFNNKNYKTGGFVETVWRQAADILLDNKKLGILEVYYTEEKPKEYEGVFLKEERALINSISRQFTYMAQQIETEKIIASYQRQLRSLASKLSLAGEEERRNISNSLHDTICQDLALSKIKINKIKKSLDKNNIDFALQDVSELINSLLNKTRALIFDISPPILYELGLEASIEWLAEKIQKEHNIRTSVYNDKRKKRLDKDLKVFLFQAVRELLINVVKHAQAKNVKININEQNEFIVIELIDDGIGIDDCKLDTIGDETGGFGLFSIKERIFLFNGSFEISGTLNKGTQIKLLAPLKQK